MAVKIVDLENLKRIGKFFSLTMSDGMAREKVLNFHEMNVINYNRVNDRASRRPLYTIEDIKFDDVPLISSVQAVYDLELVHQNCMEYGLEIDERLFAELLVQIQNFKDFYDYDTMKQHKRHILL